MPVEVRSIPDPENPGGVLVLCRSALRREKELAMISKAENRYLADTVALRERIAKGLLKDAAKIQRAIGRLEKKHPRVARFFTPRHEPGELLVTRDGGDLRDWKTLRRLLGTHCLATTRLPLEDGRVLHIRKATLPDAGQAQVYRKLGIDWKAGFTAAKTRPSSCTASRSMPPSPFRSASSGS